MCNDWTQSGKRVSLHVIHTSGSAVFNTVWVTICPMLPSACVLIK